MVAIVIAFPQLVTVALDKPVDAGSIEIQVQDNEIDLGGDPDKPAEEKD
jgi:hypothetical protein